MMIQAPYKGAFFVQKIKEVNYAKYSKGDGTD